MAVTVPEQVDTKHKKTLRDLIAGREVPKDDATAAIRWLRGDATVTSTAGGGVRLRVPLFPSSAHDLRGGSR